MPMAMMPMPPTHCSIDRHISRTGRHAGRGRKEWFGTGRRQTGNALEDGVGHAEIETRPEQRQGAEQRQAGPGEAGDDEALAAVDRDLLRPQAEDQHSADEDGRAHGPRECRPFAIAGLNTDTPTGMIMAPASAITR